MPLFPLSRKMWRITNPNSNKKVILISFKFGLITLKLSYGAGSFFPNYICEQKQTLTRFVLLRAVVQGRHTDFNWMGAKHFHVLKLCNPSQKKLEMHLFSTIFSRFLPFFDKKDPFNGQSFTRTGALHLLPNFDGCKCTCYAAAPA